jgi:hypothetical protein
LALEKNASVVISDTRDLSRILRRKSPELPAEAAAKLKTFLTDEAKALRSLAAFPIYLGEQPVGVFEVYSRKPNIVGRGEKDLNSVSLLLDPLLHALGLLYSRREPRSATSGA